MPVLLPVRDVRVLQQFHHVLGFLAAAFIQYIAVTELSGVLGPGYPGHRGLSITGDYLHFKGLELTGFKQTASDSYEYAIIASKGGAPDEP